MSKYKKIQITIEKNREKFLVDRKPFKSIIIIGPRSSGKSSIGKIINKNYAIEILELDDELDKLLKNYGGLEKIINDENWNLIGRKINIVFRSFLKRKECFVAVMPIGIFEYPISSKLREIGFLIGLIPGENDKEACEILFKRELVREHFVKLLKDRKVKLKDLEKKIKGDIKRSLLLTKEKSDYLIRGRDLSPEDIVRKYLRV